MSTSSAARENRLQATLLVQAAEAGDFGAVEALIAAGVDVNSATEQGMTALMAAAANGHLALVSFLLESGAAFKAKRQDGLDALALAVFFGHLRIVRELLGRGADMKASDRLGTSPEMWATVRGFHDIVQVLTDAETTNSAAAVAHQSNESISSLSEPISAQEPVLKEVLSPDQGLSDRTLPQPATPFAIPVQTGLDPTNNAELGTGSLDSSELTIESPVPDWNTTEVALKENQAQSYNRKIVGNAVAEVTLSRPAIFASIITPEKELSSVDSTYVPKPRYHHKRKSRKLMRGLTSGWRQSSPVDGSYVDSTYVAKPRYHHKRNSHKLVKWLAYITSDWQRLTVVTLIVMLVCGVGTVAVLNLIGLSKVSPAAKPIITEASAPSFHHVQDALQSSSRPERIPPAPVISDSAGPSVHAKKKSDDRDGPQVDDIERSRSSRSIELLPKSSKRVDRLHPKEAMTLEQETEPGSRPAQSFGSGSVSAKGIPPTNAAGTSAQNPSGAKATSQVSPRPPSTKTQRPRRVAGRNDRLVPAATPGRNTKAKVIQWP